MLTSRLCTQEQLETEEYAEWCARIREVPRLHRKQWEFVYIAQALFERGMLAPGKRGLGFGVGQEPLAALFASYGCDIVATDQDPQDARKDGWTDTGQYPESLACLNNRGICEQDFFSRHVTFRVVDMNRIPQDLVEFDFVWSSCALEHLGSIRRGQEFILRAMYCLGPGGVAVHTTEYNVSSNVDTIDTGQTVLFRRKDIEGLVHRLRQVGHGVGLDLDPGHREIDQYVDLPPYKAAPHLKLAIDRYVSTSVGLIIERTQTHICHRPERALERLKRVKNNLLSFFGIEMTTVVVSPYFVKGRRIARWFLCWMIGEQGFMVLHELWDRARDSLSYHVAAKAHGWQSAGVLSRPLRFGLNIAGAIASEGGVSEGVRTMVSAMKAGEFPYVLTNVVLGNAHRRDLTYAGEFVSENPYACNLIHVNPNKVFQFSRRVGAEYFRGKYNIGYWAWELSKFPEKWRDRFDYFDEIWTPSKFCLEALAPVSPIPVKTIAHAIEVSLPRAFHRRQFGIPEDRFVFFFMFDFYSSFERKNPLAVVRALKKAFSPDEPVMLVLKFYNSDINPRDRKRLYAEAFGPSFVLLDTYLSREETRGLLSCCDAYVSLHHSEGFGLTMAEAMALGKPVIATNYSANTDFMTGENSFPVAYRLKELERDFGLYAKGNVWAEPDIEDAARWMRYVYENRDVARRVGAKAAEEIKANLAPERVGEVIKARMGAIYRVMRAA